MIALVDGLFGLVFIIAAVMCGLGYYSYRTSDQPGVTALAAFAIVLGFGGIASGVLGLFTPVLGDPEFPLWTQVAFLFWGLAAVPWILFAVQYTGRYTQIHWRTVGGLYLPFVGIPLGIALSLGDVVDTTFINLIATIVLTYCLALVLIGAYLVVQATHTYVHLSLRHGVSLAAAPIGLFFVINMLGLIYMSSEQAAVGAYMAGFGMTTVALGYGVLQEETFDSPPAVETLGERAIARETDDLVFVVDDRDRVVKLNETAVEKLDISRAKARGRDLHELLGCSVDELWTTDTVTLETADGARRYDPQVSAVTDQHDRELGAVCSLRDVTERELREQRLAVLNRVLRHNLRNEVEVVKSHAEVLEEDAGRPPASRHTEKIITAADSIADLGRSARTIDQFVSESADDRVVDLAPAVRNAIEAVDVSGTDVSLTVDVPDSATLVTNPQALSGALESALDNALSYADSSVRIVVEQSCDECVIRITDDGPGIPENELESLDTGSESPLQHGTGLGLWQLKWAVTMLNGDLSFETASGTTVELTVPDRGADE